MTDPLAFASVAVSQLFSIVLFVLAIGLLILIAIGAGISVATALRVVAENIDYWFKRWKK